MRSVGDGYPSAGYLGGYGHAERPTKVGVMNAEHRDEVGSELSQRLAATVEGRVADGYCPSVVATVFRGPAELWHRGVGVLQESGDVPGRDSVYRIASVTKSFTAATLLLLRDRGGVNLDEPITTYVPELTQAGTTRRFDPPTVRMLLAMSGGLATDDPWADRQESISNATLRAAVARGAWVTTPPGSRFQYSNLGYALVGQVVEAVTGRSFIDVVHDELLEPLGLGDTGFTTEAAPASRLARGYRRGPEGWVALPYAGPGAFSSIGGLFSSPRDLARWVAWLASAVGDGPAEPGPLRESSRREMQQIVTALTDAGDLAAFRGTNQRIMGYGLGLIAEHDDRLGHFVSHSGGYPGFSSHIRWHAPTGLGVVVLENATYSGAWQTATTLLEAVLEDWDYATPPVVPYESTLAMARDVTSLLHQWSDEGAAALCSENVELDVPFAERRVAIERAIADIGGLTGTSDDPLRTARCDGPLSLTWTLAGHHGSLSCTIRLTPVEPPLIQTLRIEARVR